MRKAAIVALVSAHCLSSAGPTWSQNEAVHPVDRLIESVERDLRQVAGRTGILAEKKLYSIFDEELIIRDFFNDRRDGFFLDVGCANPVKGSNTYYLEKHLGWRGIGIDALREHAPAWAQKRPASKFFSYLVSDHTGAKGTLFSSPERRGLSSTDARWASGRGFGDNMETEALEVPTIRLDDLLEEQGVSRIDFLSMDIEGHEPKALAGFDIDVYRPKLVCIEKQLKKQSAAFVSGYFEKHGYELIERYRPFDPTNRYYQPKDRIIPTNESNPR